MALPLLSSCTHQLSQLEMPEPLREPNNTRIEAGALINAQPLPERQESARFSATPKSVAGPTMVVTNSSSSALPKFTTSQTVAINIEGLPLPAFINEIFGNVLELAFQLDPSLQGKKDLVTLHIPQPQSPEQLYLVVRDMLEQYGIGIINDENILKLVPLSTVDKEEPPLLISGKTLPEVPITHRTVFQFIPLSVVSHNDVSLLLHGLNKSGQLTVSESPLRNAMLLSGPPAIVRQAVEAIRFLDQPLMRGRYSLRIEPVFLNAEQLSQELEKILQTEGYAVSVNKPALSTSTVLLPIKPINALLAFASDEDTLDHIRHWVQVLDKPGLLKSQTGLFFYPVQNVSAETLAEVIAPLLDTDGVVRNNGTQTEADNNVQTSAKNTAVAINVKTPTGSRLVVDPLRNALLFQGKSEEWVRLLPILKEMDKPSKMVLIEVTIAELSMDSSEALGIEWQATGLNLGGEGGTLSTNGGLGVGNSQGISFTLVNGLGQTRALLNAFATNKRANVLSSPRLMVKSGEEANINIGNEVPIQSNTRVDATGTQIDGSTTYLQQIQYRKTGIILNVKPVVHAGNRIDLEISQSISNALATDTSNIDSPTIQNRSLETKLSLEDGGSVLLGGLISETVTDNASEVPGLGKIPVIGHLFRNDGKQRERLNLIMLIVPYVINNDVEAREITQTFRSGVLRGFEESATENQEFFMKPTQPLMEESDHESLSAEPQI